MKLRFTYLLYWLAILYILIINEECFGAKTTNTKNNNNNRKKGNKHDRRSLIIRCCGRKTCVPTGRPTTTVVYTTSVTTTTTTEAETTTMTTSEIPTTLAPTVTTVSSSTTLAPVTNATTNATTIPPCVMTCLNTADTCKDDVALAANAISTVNNDPKVAGTLMKHTIGDKSYHINADLKLNYFDSLKFCRQHGMDLTVLETQAENDAVATKVGALGKSGEAFFTGGQKIGKCYYNWIDNPDANYTYSSWQPGDPANPTTENCMMFKGGKWLDFPCGSAQPFICEGTTTTTTTPCPMQCNKDSANCKDDVGLLAKAITTINDDPKVAGTLVEHTVGDKSYHISGIPKLNFFDALKFCRQHGMELAVFDTQAENDAVATKVNAVGLGGEALFTGGQKIGKCYYNWIDKPDANYTYTSWQPGDPVDPTTENCMMFKGGKWVDLPCTFVQPFICEGSTTTTTTPCPLQCNKDSVHCKDDVGLLANAITTINADPKVAGNLVEHTVGDKSYHLSGDPKLNFFDALKFCRQHGMELAVFDTQAENDAVATKVNAIGLGGEPLFTGGQKIGKCYYNWIDKPDTNITYASWQPGDPVNPTTENCMMFKGGKWLDYPCTFVQPFICEGSTTTTTTPCPLQCNKDSIHCKDDVGLLASAISTVNADPKVAGNLVEQTIGDKSYHISGAPKLNFFDALKFCRQHGMELAVFDTLAENDAVASKVNAAGLGGEPLFTGGQKIGKCYYNWIDKPDANYTYTSWQPGDPFNPNTENCMMFMGGKWLDYPCTFVQPFICEGSTTTTPCPLQCNKDSVHCKDDVSLLANAITTLNADPKVAGNLVEYTVGDKSYHLSGDPKLNFFDALKFCRQHGMDLAVFDTQAENDAVATKVNAIGLGGEALFTGGQKIGKCYYNWIDKPDATLTYASWQPGDPVNPTTENCMMFKGGKWLDYPCTFVQPFICEGLPHV